MKISSSGHQRCADAAYLADDAHADIKESSMIDPAFLAKLVERYKARTVKQVDLTQLAVRQDDGSEQTRAA